ncbi:hypothetical protein HUW46_00102 [Amycolatopsis sp. CA-230715]|nr:hypothetical protein HUW46_00102 [Amycolatopsis sp. CA-230715]
MRRQRALPRPVSRQRLIWSGLGVVFAVAGLTWVYLAVTMAAGWAVAVAGFFLLAAVLCGVGSIRDL